MTPPSRFIRDEEAQLILSLRATRMSIREIAERTGRREGSIQEWLRRHNAPAFRAPVTRSRKMARRAGAVLRLALEGKSAEQVAQELKLNVAQVRHVVRLDTLMERMQLSYIATVAKEGGTTTVTLRNLIHSGELEGTRFFHYWTFNPDQVTAALAYLRDNYRTADQVQGWLSSEQLAREFCVTLGTLLHWFQDRDHRVHGITRVRVLGMAGQVWRYHPEQALLAVRRAARPILPASIPRGMFTPEQLAPVLHRSPSTIHTWTLRYRCPHRNTAGGRLYFNPHEVADWLDTRNPRLATRLRAHLQQTRAA